ncbi:MAG: endolytic transglycosylase MltG [Defluviitaleaceae bacterium]|nr:endolytic transglycosylase MltG [Defluviitaleaceae bacterium]
MWRKVINVSNYLAGGLFNIGLVVAIIVIAYFIINRAFDFGFGLLADDGMSRPSQEVIVEIPEDASAMDTARILRENNLIANEFIFYLSAFMNGSTRHFMNGTFTLNMNMSQEYLMEALQSTRYLRQEEGRIVIIEGRTNWQVANLAATLGYFTAAEFTYELENGFFAHSFLEDIAERPQRLEGFLFPDTYHLPPNPVPRDLIVRMLDRFDQIFNEAMWARFAELEFELGWRPTLEQVVTVASLIEVEAVNASDRPIVASVIYNRLAAGMPLELVSTVVYATNTAPDQLTAAQFNVNSPYNTFNRTGLPIGPINNPGLLSLEAALSPALSDYLYMMPLDEGMFFANSQEEYLAMRAGQME